MAYTEEMHLIYAATHDALNGTRSMLADVLKGLLAAAAQPRVPFKLNGATQPKKRPRPPMHRMHTSYPSVAESCWRDAQQPVHRSELIVIQRLLDGIAVGPHREHTSAFLGCKDNKTKGRRVITKARATNACHGSEA